MPRRERRSFISRNKADFMVVIGLTLIALQVLNLWLLLDGRKKLFSDIPFTYQTDEMPEPPKPTIAPNQVPNS